MQEQGAEFWPLRLARELDDAILDLRINELEHRPLVFKSEGDPTQVLAYDAFLDANQSNWLAREIRLYWKRVLKRVDVTSRSLVAMIEPGSCFAGTLAEIVFACDRSYMLIGQLNGDNRPPATIALGAAEFRRLSDAERDHPAGKPLPRRRRVARSAQARRSARCSTRKPPRSSASSPSRSTTSTGRTRSASSSKSARASRPTASPAWKPICASAGRRRWNRKSSRA